MSSASVPCFFRRISIKVTIGDSGVQRIFEACQEQVVELFNIARTAACLINQLIWIVSFIENNL